MTKKINGYKVELIGNGGNASVFKTKNDKGENCALKKLDNETGNEEKKQDSYVRLNLENPIQI